MLYSHSLTSKGPAMYEEITHIPLIIKGFGENRTDPHPVSHINLAPTVMDIFGLPVPKVMEGSSIYRELLDGTRTNEYVFIEFGRYEVDHDGFGGYQPVRAVYDGRYKLAVNLMTSDELYDLQEDPQELVNLINSQTEEHMEVKLRLHKALLDNIDVYKRQSLYCASSTRMGAAIFFMALICAAPPTRETLRPALTAGRKPALNISVSR